MTENEHVIIAVNDREVSSEAPERLDDNRGRNRKRSKSRSRSSSRSRTRRDIETATRDASPLIPENALPKQKPPERGPEIDDDDDENDEDNNFPTSGIDDGFLDENEIDGPTRGKPTTSNGHDSRRGSKVPVFPTTFPVYGPGVVINGETPRIIPDINVYQHKKSLAQGFMDLALLSANANQLRYVLESYERHPYYYFSLSFIITSLIIQVVVGVGLVLNSRYDIKNQDDICKADRINNLITVGILLITIINVFISAFGVAEKL